MKKLGQISIVLFVIVNTLFDLISTSENTHLSIVFFSIMYLSFLLFCFYDIYIFWNRDKIKNSFSIVMGMGFTVRILWEISKWNLPYKMYMESVNNFERGLLFSFLLIALLLGAISHDRK